MSLQKFEEYLKDLPLQESSKKAYYKIVKELLATVEGISIEHLNHFIAVKCSNRQPHAKYAIKKYLECMGKGQDYLQLHKALIKQPIKDKVFLSKEQVYKIINCIKNPMHKSIAICQYNTGTRASEILTIRKQRISKQKINDMEVIRINVRGKGDRPRYVYLLAEFWKYIEPYYSNCRDYPFLNDKNNPIPYLSFWDRVETSYKRYYESLKSAAKECGFNLATHDLRRSFANDLRKETDIYQVQKTLGHKDINTTTKYLEVRSEDIAGAMLHQQNGFLPMESAILEINQDLVRELKLRGLDTKEVLKAHYANKEKAKQNVLDDEKRQIDMIKASKKIS